MVFLQSLRQHPLRIKLERLLPSQAWESRPSLYLCLGAFTLIFSLLLGGGTRGGFLSDSILELLAIVPFLAALSALIGSLTRISRSAGYALMFCLAIALLPLLQLVPLPPQIWSLLPQRGATIDLFNLLGQNLPWLPVSVVPTATWLAVLSLLPPITVFLCTIQLSYPERRVLSLVLLAVGIVAAFLGLAQVAQGPSSPLRFFAFTNENEAVGFFANRNHLAALLYVLLVFAAAWATDVAFAVESWRDIKRLETSSIAALIASLLTIIVLIAAETITRSRAGVGLMILGMFGAFALPLADRRRQTAGIGTPVKLILGAMTVAVLLGVQFALYRILDRFSLDPLASARPIFARDTIRAAIAYLPFGSGFGTFVSVYPTFERSRDLIANIYANHAHDDILEIALEGGAVAIILMISFAIWIAWRFRDAWWHPPADARSIDILLRRAATIAVLLVIAHSFVDYPLRTDAMMAVLAFCCGLLVEPVYAAGQPIDRTAFARQEPNREKLVSLVLSARPAAVPLPGRREITPVMPAPSRAAPRPAEPWGENIAWPEQWLHTKGGKSGADDESEPETGN